MRTLFLVAALVGPGSDKKPQLEDRPLGNAIHFQAIHYAEGKDKPREWTIFGTLNGTGKLDLNPNHLMLGPDGRVNGSTLLGWTPIPVRIKFSDAPDPDGKGRKVYDIVPEKGEHKRSFRIVLSANEAGPHHLIIREGDKTVATSTLLDPDREGHQDQIPQLAEASAEQRQAIEDLRKVVGYRFRFRLESKGAVTFLYFPYGVDDIGSVDAALGGLTRLGYLSFNGGKLGPAGLKCIAKMPELKTLDFASCNIDDAGLACIKDATHLVHMSFFGSRGLSDAGMAHFKELKNLTLLDLRNESFTETTPKAPRITDAGLALLAGHDKLEYLNLQGQHITDAGLKHLRGMSKLQTLSVSFSGVTDEGLKELEGLKDLKQLHLYGTRVTKEGRASLKSKIPGLMN